MGQGGQILVWCRCLGSAIIVYIVLQNIYAKMTLDNYGFIFCKWMVVDIKLLLCQWRKTKQELDAKS